jgi:GT2 family glycosyltransferase
LHFRIGGFDESLPCLEDTDYVWKAQLMAGAEIHFVPEAIMRVRYRTSLRGTYRQAVNYAEYNVFLSRRYRAHGDPRPNAWRTYFKGWKHLVYDMRRLGRGESRNAWVGKLGWMVGRTKGIVKYRVPPV